ncbi:MAG: DUF72 domain-containing protein [Nitrososphaerota archaeon]|nr:DUF72 domain-containing protein [Nitrososphaerota archaeon]
MLIRSLDLRIGTGGWQYLNVTGDRLSSYSKRFNFVEVNSTFYSNPSFRLVESWKKRVSQDFEFSVKCNRAVTHENMLHPSPEAMAEVNYMVRVCKILEAGCIVFQTSASLMVNRSILTGAREIWSQFKDENITVVLETRNPLEEDTISCMEELGILHSVDLTRGLPGYRHEKLYSRLFGTDRYSRTGFGESEYESIETGLKKASPQKAYLAFHGIQMYRDAEGFKNRLAGIH